MSHLLRLLIVEDNEDDAELTLMELRRGGYEPLWKRVQTRADMEAALKDEAWDLVICDHRMPRFSSAQAMDLLRDKGLEIPLIVVSGAAPEEVVTRAMRNGARDFISKSSLVRLVPAVQRELSEVAEHREKERIASRLAESERRYESLFNENPAPMLLVDARTLLIVDANRAAATFFGHSLESLRQVTVEALSGQAASGPWKKIQRVQTQDQGQDAFLFQDQVVRKDGSIREVEISAVKLSQGKRPVLLATLFDQTERKIAEARIVKLATVVEQVADAIAIMDVSGAIEYVNRAFERLTEHPLAELQGWALHDLLEHGDVKGATARAALGESWTGRISIALSPGHPSDLDITCLPVRDARGTVSNVVAVLRDITIEMEMERQLRQSQKLDALGTLAAGVAHDFNNILGAILDAAGALQEGLPDDSPLHAMVDAIRHAGICAGSLTKQILSFSRAPQEDQRPVDFSAIVRGSLQLLYSTQPPGVEIESSLTSGLWVEGNPAQLHQLVLNLAINAFQAMQDKGGLLYITLSEVPAGEGPGGGRSALLTVRDTGCGMEAGILDRIFDPFFTTRPSGEGVGLGLTLVQAAVTKAGGRIKVHSRPGEGTTFHIHWPCVTGYALPSKHGGETLPASAPAIPAGIPWGIPAAAAEARHEAQVPARNGKGALILLAEDSHMTRTVIRTWLEKAGHQVRAAQDGMEALDLFLNGPDRGRFNLLLTDVVMPRLDGMELIRLVRKADASLPIAILTSNEDKETVKVALNLGVNEFLNKPFEAPELIHCVERLVAEQTSRAEERRSVETAQAVRLAQRAMVALPEKDLPLYSIYEPLTDAGGDVFRCLRCADGSILFILADVAGHSVLSSYSVAAFLAILSGFLSECASLMPMPAYQGGSDTDRQAHLVSCGFFGQIPCDPLPHLARKLNLGIQTGPFSEIPVCALFGRWDSASGRLQLLNAGIPHGLILRGGAQGEARVEPIEINGTPLGIFPEAMLETTSLQLHPGDRLLFGTDGFFDVLSADQRPFQDQAPASWMALQAHPIDRALSRVCEDAREHGQGLITDDLLVIGFEQPTLEESRDDLVLRIPSTAHAIDVACIRLDECMRNAAMAADLPASKRFDISIAVREALTNAMIHGNAGRVTATMTLRCRSARDGRGLQVSVSDEGPGFDLESHAPPEDPLSERGRGIPLIRAYAQEVRMQGSELTMTFHL